MKIERLKITDNFAPVREAIKDCYEILSGIPNGNINLGSYVGRGKGRPTSCGTITCGAGWLGLHPEMSQRLGFTVNEFGALVHAKSHGQQPYYLAHDQVFRGLPIISRTLFDARSGSALRFSHVPHCNDREMLLARFRLVLFRTGVASTCAQAEKTMDGFLSRLAYPGYRVFLKTEFEQYLEEVRKEDYARFVNDPTLPL